MRSPRILITIPLAALSMLASGQKKPLDHSVYDGWKSISGTTISRDGKWIALIVSPQEGDAMGTLRAVADGHTISLPRASTIQFTRDGKYALATIIPPFLDSRKATRDKVKPEDHPKNALVIVDLGSGTTTMIERVTSFTLPREDSGWFAYRPEPPKPTPPVAEKKEGADDEDAQGRAGGARAEASAPTPGARGATYVLRQLGTGKEEKIEFLDAIAWDKPGRTFAYSTVADKEGKGSMVEARDLPKGTKTVIAEGVDKAKYPKLALTDDGSRLAFSTDKDDLKAKKPALSLYVAKVEEKKNTLVPIPHAGDSVNEGAGFRFTPTGKRLIFSTSPKPIPEPEATPADEKVSVDIWTYRDERIMPQQLIAAAAERARGYEAVYDVASGKAVQIETKEMPSAQFGDRGDGPYALASVNLPYRLESGWSPDYADLYAIDLRTGERRKLLTKWVGTTYTAFQATSIRPSGNGLFLSPDGRRAVVYRGDKREWIALDLANGGSRSLSGKIPYPVYDELDDHPDDAPAQGFVGWTKGGRALVRDRFDIWSCDPDGIAAPINLTGGRASGIAFDAIDLDAEDPYVRVDDLPLVALHDETKNGGLYWRKGSAVRKIFLEGKRFGGLQKAQDAETLVYTRQDEVEFPDLWLTDTNFAAPKKVTDANPQQREYNWLTAELVSWTSADGVPLRGILYKPEDFDAGKKYPMIATFYERWSDTFRSYRAPSPSASSVNIPLFVSQGYLVFVPDIPYKKGEPGLSALSAIVPGVSSVVSRGYVDPKRIGIQGQSWGGYQVAYLVTATNMFAAGEAGAPVVDMFSAYGGVRYGTGILRQEQYERGQSRIGGTPWDSFNKYVENSPLFRADRIQTPLMIMSNDKDGAVPHTQGIEMYAAMRRLQKPVWMVVYNDEDHNIVARKNRKDFSIRLSQFFDHFLKGAPMPVWMKSGVPAVDKGRTMGTELTTP